MDQEMQWYNPTNHFFFFYYITLKHIYSNYFTLAVLYLFGYGLLCNRHTYLDTRNRI